VIQWVDLLPAYCPPRPERNRDISVIRDGSTTFSEFGPRDWAIVARRVQILQSRYKITGDSNGVATAETLAVVQKIAKCEGQPQGSISLAYYHTSDGETAILNVFIQATIQVQVQGEPPFCFNAWRDYCLAGRHAASLTASHYANLN
jgi:hypothetical protein